MLGTNKVVLLLSKEELYYKSQHNLKPEHTE